jgi:hypothetical protein
MEGVSMEKVVTEVQVSAGIGRSMSGLGVTAAGLGAIRRR